MDCLISSMATEEVLLPLGMFADIEHGLGTPLGSQELEITVGAAPDASMHPEEPGSAGVHRSGLQVGPTA